MDSAKVFMTGRSQAVRLPKAYRFNTEEVLIERQSDGALLLRPKQRPRLGERLRAILRAAPVDPAFLRPEQPRLERDARWWARHSFGAVTPRKRRTKR
jgi:antitoxin VapB